jgi:hypothetical protein
LFDHSGVEARAGWLHGPTAVKKPNGFTNASGVEPEKSQSAEDIGGEVFRPNPRWKAGLMLK